MHACARQLALVSMIVGLTVLHYQASAQNPDPLAGTWKLNGAKSKYSPGPAPKSLTLKIDAAGDGEKVVADGVRAANGVARTVRRAAAFERRRSVAANARRTGRAASACVREVRWRSRRLKDAAHVGGDRAHR